jgi:hypothetical protein
MTAKTASLGTASDLPVPEPEEARSAERFPCALETTCQPPSAWGQDPWPATIRNISTGGLSLSMHRRFERGSGLAIELPADDGTTSTVLAKVVFVRPDPEGGWLLGCSFISELSEEEVRSVLQWDQVQQARPAADEEDESAAPVLPPEAVGVSGVLFQARLKPSGQVARWYIKQLDLTGKWPLERGKVVVLQMGNPADNIPPVHLSVRSCRPFGVVWVVNCKFLTPPPRELLLAIGQQA